MRTIPPPPPTLSLPQRAQGRMINFATIDSVRMWEGLKERRGEASSILSSASLQLSPPGLHLRKKSQWVPSLDPPNHLHLSSPPLLRPPLPPPARHFFSSPAACLLPSKSSVNIQRKRLSRLATRRKEPRAERGRAKCLENEKQKYLPLLKFINYLASKIS